METRLRQAIATDDALAACVLPGAPIAVGVLVWVHAGALGR
jgi:hypothetical protein